MEMYFVVAKDIALIFAHYFVYPFVNLDSRIKEIQ